MSDFIAGHEIAIQDTGAPRGERNYWRVLLNGQSVYEGHNGAQAQRTYRAVSEGLKRAAQPTAGEPVAYCDDFTLEKLKSNLAYSVGVTPAAQRYPDDVHALYVGPPAAAHGDEAVRKDATESAIQRACKELPEGWSMQIELERGAGDVTLFNAWDIVVDFGKDFESSISAQVEAAIDAAMRAQGDDRLLFTDAIMPGGMTET